jgi:hypothetical protein
MDCAKNLGLIATAIPMHELEKAVPFLMQNDFIVLAKDQQLQHAIIKSKPNNLGVNNDDKPAAIRGRQNPAIIPAPPLTPDPQIIVTVKHLMETTANTYLGLMGAHVISRIQRCHSAEQLLGAAAHWHMALRESKIGIPVAKDLLDEVKAMLQLQH